MTKQKLIDAEDEKRRLEEESAQVREGSGPHDNGVESSLLQALHLMGRTNRYCRGTGWLFPAILPGHI